MSSVQTTISAAISEEASEDEGLAGLERCAFGFEVGVARLLRPEGVALEAPLAAPEVTPSLDQLSVRFLVLADFPIVRGGACSSGAAMDGFSGTIYQIPAGGPPQVGMIGMISRSGADPCKRNWGPGDIGPWASVV